MITNIYYEIYGEQNNEIILFLHGNGENLHIFDKSITFFKKKYKVIAVDSPEHGNSKSTNAKNNNRIKNNNIRNIDTKLDIPYMASEINELIEKMGLSDIILVGFSDGANIAMELASDYNNSAASSNKKIKKMVLVGGNLKPSGMKTVVLVGVFFAFIKYSLFSFIYSERLKQRYYKIMLCQPEITKKKLAKIDVPTLIVVGENDMIKHSHTKKINTFIKNSKLEIIQDGNHFLFAKKNKTINELIEKFIK